MLRATPRRRFCGRTSTQKRTGAMKPYGRIHVAPSACERSIGSAGPSSLLWMRKRSADFTGHFKGPFYGGDSTSPRFERLLYSIGCGGT